MGGPEVHLLERDWHSDGPPAEVEIYKQYVAENVCFLGCALFSGNRSMLRERCEAGILNPSNPLMRSL